MKNKLVRRLIAVGMVGIVTGALSGSAVADTRVPPQPHWQTCWYLGIIPYSCFTY